MPVAAAYAQFAKDIAPRDEIASSVRLGEKFVESDWIDSSGKLTDDAPSAAWWDAYRREVDNDFPRLNPKQRREWTVERAPYFEHALAKRRGLNPRERIISTDERLRALAAEGSRP